MKAHRMTRLKINMDTITNYIIGFRNLALKLRLDNRLKLNIFVQIKPKTYSLSLSLSIVFINYITIYRAAELDIHTFLHIIGKPTRTK